MDPNNSNGFNISWYSNVYYSYRDYPIKDLNIKYKKSELKGIYNNLMKKTFNTFEVSIENSSKQLKESKLQDSNNRQNSSFIDQDRSLLGHSHNVEKNSQIDSSGKDSNSQSEKISSDSGISIENHSLNNYKQQQKGHQQSSVSNMTSSEKIVSERPSDISSLSHVQSSKHLLKSSHFISSSPQHQKILKDLELAKACENMIGSSVQGNRNMDVLYELMVSMIRLTMKRTTVEIDQQLKKTKETELKFDVIDEEGESSEEENAAEGVEENEDDFEDFSSQENSNHGLSNDSSGLSLPSENRMDSDRNENYKLVINYASSLGKQGPEKQKQSGRPSQSRNSNQETINSLEYKVSKIECPKSLEELKFEFLRYCTVTNVPHAAGKAVDKKPQKLDSFPSASKESQGELQDLTLLKTASCKSNKPKSEFSKKQSISELNESEEESQLSPPKENLRQYFTELTEMGEEEMQSLNHSSSSTEMESLVMKLATFEMKSFNVFIGHYLKKVQQSSTVVNVIGLDAITDSMYQMALGKEARNNGIKTQVGLGNSQVKLFSSLVDQECSNILLTTWVDLVLFSEKPEALYQIIEEISRQSQEPAHQGKRKKAWTPSIYQNSLSPSAESSKKEQSAVLFKEKMLSLFNFLILNTTKNIFIESLSKANFLSLVVTEIIPSRSNRRRLQEFELRNLKDSELGQVEDDQKIKDMKFLFSQQETIVCYDLTFSKETWTKEAIDVVFDRWKKVVEIIFEEQVRRPTVHWELTFEKCAALISRQFSLLTVLVFNLVEIIENIEAEISRMEAQKMTPFKKLQIRRHRSIKECLEFIVKEFIGCEEIFQVDETLVNQIETKLFSSIDSISSYQDFYKKEVGQKFIHREAKTKELEKWEEIVSANNIIIQHYIYHLEMIRKIFGSEPFYVGSWFVNFHTEVKVLIKKVSEDNLSLFFDKFYEKVPKLWESLNAEELEGLQSRVQNHKKASSFEWTNMPSKSRQRPHRQRLSSIKRKRQLSALEKKALVMNYMIKTELQLFESYTKSHALNEHDESSTMTTIISGNSTLKTNMPLVFQEKLIQSLLIFNFDPNFKSNRKKSDILINSLVQRSNKVHLTLKPLSSFAPSKGQGQIQQRSSQSKDSRLNLFHKKNSDATNFFGSLSNKPYQNNSLLAKKDKDFVEVCEYEIDIQRLDEINYTKEEINFLIELNSHLKFINEINFEYEYYYWKDVSAQRKVKEYGFAVPTNEGQSEKVETYSTAETNLRNQHSQETEKKVNFAVNKKAVTFNEYLNEKTKSLLTTFEIFEEIKEICQVLPGERASEQQIGDCKKTQIAQQSPESLTEKNMYREKLEEVYQRFKIHNQSLSLIVGAAMEAKNYWKNVSYNMILEENSLTSGNSMQFSTLKDKTKLHKSGQLNFELYFQQRFFEKKILEKLSEYINNYRDLTKQINFTVNSVTNLQNEGKFLDGYSPAKESKESNQSLSIHEEDSESSKTKIVGDQGLLKEHESDENKYTRRGQKKPSIYRTIEENKQHQTRFYSLIQSLICRKEQPKMNIFEIASQIYQYSDRVLKLNCFISSFYLDRKIYLDIISHEELSTERYSKVKIIGKKYFEKIMEHSSQIKFEGEITEGKLKNVQCLYESKLLLILIGLIETLYYGNEQRKSHTGRWRHSNCDVQQNQTFIGKSKHKIGTPNAIDDGYQGVEDQPKRYSNHGFKVNKNTLKKYGEVLKKYFKYRFLKNSNKIQGKSDNFYSFESAKQHENKSDYHYISKLFSEVFQFQDSEEDYSEQKLINIMRKLRTTEEDEGFLGLYVTILENEERFLSCFETDQQKVNCLKKKFNYLVMREVYFFLYYDTDCLQEKSAYSKKNYELYESRILEFYSEIAKKSYSDFMVKKEMELKKRSVYLQNYLMKYEEEPSLHYFQKKLNKLLVCLFNQIMLIHTQDIKTEMKKKGQNLDVINQRQKQYGDLSLHSQFLSSEFYYNKDLFIRNSEDTENNELTDEVFGDTFQGVSMKMSNQNQERKSKLFLDFSNMKIINQKSAQFSSSNQISSSRFMSNNNAKNDPTTEGQLKQEKTFKVYTTQSMHLYEAINVYRHHKKTAESRFGQYVQELLNSFKDLKTFKREDLTEMELQTLEVNEESIVSLLKSDIMATINQKKFELVHKNLISRIQKLYINLDVRHKVFESFKDKILSYEMQKAKIYHQYMDYIRGLKLDVYSHIANEDSLPYIKIVSAIKFYRLSVKKEELENKVRQQLGKNLQKWNAGIQEDLNNYRDWLLSEQKQWTVAKDSICDYKRDLLGIFDAVKKELKRQLIKKERQESLKRKSSLHKSTKNNNKSFQVQQFEKEIKQLKKVAMTSNVNPFLKYKQSQRQLKDPSDMQSLESPKNAQCANPKLKNPPISLTYHQSKLERSASKNARKSAKPSNSFKKQKPMRLQTANPSSCGFYKPSTENEKCQTFHRSNEKPIRNRMNIQSYHFEKPLQSRRETLSRKIDTQNPHCGDFNNAFTRAQTAQTREKSLELSKNEYRGIKMKFFSKSTKKLSNYTESTAQPTRIAESTEMLNAQHQEIPIIVSNGNKLIRQRNAQKSPSMNPMKNMIQAEKQLNMGFAPSETYQTLELRRNSKTANNATNSRSTSNGRLRMSCHQGSVHKYQKQNFMTEKTGQNKLLKTGRNVDSAKYGNRTVYH